MSMSWHLYVLRLSTGDTPEPRWYVGITRNYDQRIRAHRNGTGHNWTKQFDVVEDYQVLSTVGRYVIECSENNLVRALTQEFGSDVVRGGDLSSSNPGTAKDEVTLHPVLSDRLGQLEDDQLNEVAEAVSTGKTAFVERETAILSCDVQIENSSGDQERVLDTPFDASEASQRQLYVRPRTWHRFGLACDEVRIELVQEYGIDEVPKRELHDAALRVAAEHRLEVLENVAETRKERK